MRQPEHLPREGDRRAARPAGASADVAPSRPRRRGDGDSDRPAGAQHVRPVRDRQADRGRQGAVSILGGTVGRQHQQHRAVDAGGTRRACRRRARSYPNPYRRRQEPRQGPRKGHGPPPFPDTGAEERGHQAARAGRNARRIGPELQRQLSYDFEVSDMISSPEAQGTDEEAAGAMPLASIEPHRQLLRFPNPDQRLFKVVKVRYLIDMLQKNYLHFQRVDSYTDDKADGEQLPLDRPVGAGISFEKAPTYTLDKYYDCARARTYACCFSLEHSSYIWEHYAPDRDAVCLAFNFDKLRHRLNATMQASLDNSG